MNQSNFYRLLFLFAVPPQRPRLEHEGVHVPPGHNVTVDSGAMATVKCVSHYGNPPAQLKWFLGKRFIRLNLALSTSVSEIFRYFFSALAASHSMHPLTDRVSCRIFGCTVALIPLLCHIHVPPRFPKAQEFSKFAASRATYIRK